MKDRAVLENHHAASTFMLLQNPNFDILANFTREDYAKIRERIVSMVLATDMSIHFSEIGKLKTKLIAKGFKLIN